MQGFSYWSIIIVMSNTELEIDQGFRFFRTHVAAYFVYSTVYNVRLGTDTHISILTQ